MCTLIQYLSACSLITTNAQKAVEATDGIEHQQSCALKGGVGKFEKPARDTLFVIFNGMLLTSR